MSDNSALHQNLSWLQSTLGDCFIIDSGTVPPLLSDDGTVAVMGANGSIGRTIRSNFGPGFIVGRVGSAGAIARVSERVWASDNTLALLPTSLCNADFAYFVLIAANLQALATTTAQPLITQSNIAAVKIRLPPLPEQHVIAQILNTLDTAIQKTEAIVEKLKQVKQGLLHDLLTRGIDANGELRPSHEQAPHLYKESPLGWIPQEWECLTLSDVTIRITDGTHQSVTTGDQNFGEVPFLFVSCVRAGEVVWEKSAFITIKDYQRISKGREPEEGIVLYTAVGSYGHAAGVARFRDFAFQRHIACIYPRKEKVAPGFVSLILNWESIRRHADRVALGNAQKTVTLGELSAFPFVCPDMDEQQEITIRIGSMNERLGGELQTLAKLRKEKNGLMDDLLTGRVRVTRLLKKEDTDD